MLRGGMEEPGGTSQALWEYDLFNKENEIGGKTGTSSEYVDGWYMGVTKDLVTAVWVGCDDRNIHFKNSQTGEGSKTALPIFGLFMEAIYKDKALGYTQGKFPAPTVEITKKYNCETPRPPREEVLSDSTAIEDELPLEELENSGNEGATQEEGLSTPGQGDQIDVLSSERDAVATKPRDSIGNDE
ncbi:Penicillin-binding protein 1A [compost metagenome]